jgi:UDP-2-acetamido-3-amino-2,3-dideoxy-glucuronate N-acetyltransferase
MPPWGLLGCRCEQRGFKALDHSSEQETLAGVVVSPALAKPKVAAIGCGQWGKNIIRNLSQLGALSAVSDLATTVASEFSTRYAVPARRYEELLEDEEVEAVAIATPAAFHALHARQALEAGKHVFVEKPLAMSVPDGQVLAKMARDRQRVLMVGHVLRYHPAVRKLLQEVRSGRLGTVRHIYSRRLSLGRFRTEEDVLWSLAPHDISIILAIFGDLPQRVSAHGRPILNSPIADIARVHLDFANGVTADVAVSWLNPVKEHKLVLIGSRAQAVFDDTAKWSEKLQIFDHGIDVSSGAVRVIRAEPVLVRIDEKEPLREECAHFLSCVAASKTPRTDSLEALRVLRVLEAAANSMALGGETIRTRHPVAGTGVPNTLLN